MNDNDKQLLDDLKQAAIEAASGKAKLSYAARIQLAREAAKRNRELLEELYKGEIHLPGHIAKPRRKK